MVRAGDKWAAVECIEVGKVTTNRYAEDENGNKYVADSWAENAYVFRCLCGTEFKVTVKLFRGRKAHRDCGCGRAGFSGPHVVMAFSTNSGVKGHVEALSRLDGHGNASLIINTALREYFERREGDRDNGWKG